VAQAGVAGTASSTRADGRPEGGELVAERRVVVDLDVLRDLEDDLPSAVAEEGWELARGDERGRGFQAEVRPGREDAAASRAASTVAVSSSIPGRPAREGEDDVRPDAVGEATEGLVATTARRGTRRSVKNG